MTINEFIKTLQELGDENWRNQANVRILSSNGKFLDEPSTFDVKRGITSADIYTELSDKGESFKV